MIKQIIFIFSLVITLGIFGWSALRVIKLIRLTKKAYKLDRLGKRFLMLFEVAFLQTKILRKPVIGLLHALVFWGFCVILFGSIEMVVDGISGSERTFAEMGLIYNIFIASGDVFALVIALAILVFLARRIFHLVRRFEGIEMKKKSHQDANLALTIIFLLMISLLGMNIFYQLLSSSTAEGFYPVTSNLLFLFSGFSVYQIHILHEVFWWIHILLVFLFANILPYSKHFHVFMSLPNVFLSRLEPLGKLTTMESITREVKLMMDPNLAFSAPSENYAPVDRFGVQNAEDVNWKNYVDSLSCTQCGRCTSVCPANITGKKLSPRKIFIDLRARMKEKGPYLLKKEEFNDGKSYIGDYVTTEEIWACTTCNACATECPINIDHPRFIIDMRRYLVLEQSAAPAGLNAVFSNIENNGAPWQFSPEDRMLWSENLEISNVETKE